MYKRVLLPLDGSMIAETIIPFLLEIAGPLDMDITLLRVVVPTPPMAIESHRDISADHVEKLRSDAEQYLAGAAAELRFKGVRVQAQVRVGEAVADDSRRRPRRQGGSDRDDDPRPRRARPLALRVGH
jgi:nucleotide-binding universal stress UspA family protein